MWDWLDRHADVRTSKSEFVEDTGNMHHVDFDWYYSNVKENTRYEERD